MSEFKSLEKKVIEWAHDKGILDKSTPLKQHEKTQEEVDEIFEAIKKSDRMGLEDGIGDTVVTLIIQCELNGLYFLNCLRVAYDVISRRTGKMVDGIFVKDA